jgi:predicted ATPase
VGCVDPPELASRDRRGLARALQAALTANGPAVGVIEDAHWGDPATLDVVRLLARRAEDAALAVVVTLRDDEPAANPPLRAQRAGGVRLGGLRMTRSGTT